MTQQMQVVEQKTIVFYDDELIAVKLEDGRTVVPVKPICDALGRQLGWAAPTDHAR